MTKLKPTRMPMNKGDKLHMAEKMTRDSQEKYTRNSYEDRMIEAMDNKKQILKFMQMVESLEENKLDVQSFFQGMAPQVAKELMFTALSEKTSEKGKIAAMQDVLDRAGYGKITKHAVASVDASTSRETILALIAGKAGKIPGVEIVDDIEDET